MQIEYEATFPDVDKGEIRRKLEANGAKLVKKEFLQKRIVFDLPKGHEIEGGWLRLRDEGDKITMTLKVIGGNRIEEQKETLLEIDSFEKGLEFLMLIGCNRRSYQENKREVWKLGTVEIMLDDWPFLEPLAEIEGLSEVDVKEMAEKLGFDYAKARFCSISEIYNEKYQPKERFDISDLEEFTFSINNPFLKI
ncbi:MAG: CYTH domain-containing protein [Parcubacteria group bacterium]|jgi:adenylate cyclase class 2